MKKNVKHSKHTPSAAKLRIIGGEWRSRQLPILDVDGLRPTTDRVRETVFNWLSFDVPAARCLDLFCGSGALGLEALSRGAKECTFVELNKQVAQQIQRNLATLNAHNGQVIQADALRFLQQPNEPYDLIFLDPPFRKDLLDHVIPALDAQWIKSGGHIYIERETEKVLPSLPSNWQLLKEKTAGQLTYSLYYVM